MASKIKMFEKTVPLSLGYHEIELQTIAAKYGFCPNITRYIENDTTVTIFMPHLENDCIANVYGDDPEEIPEWIWNEMRTMIRTLYEQEGIEYVDITPYNFIEKDNRIYMIDFGDAKYTDEEPNWFLIEFLAGENSWNPDYK